MFTPLLGWLVACLVGLAAMVPAGRLLDGPILDLQFRLLRTVAPIETTARDPVLVGIDEATYDAFEWPLGLWYPHLGDFLSAMAAARAGMVVLDLVLPARPVPDTLVRLADEGHLPYLDDALLEALIALDREGIPVVFAEAPDDSGTRINRGNSEILSLLSSLGDVELYFGYAQVPLDRDGYQRHYRSEVAGRPTLMARAAQHAGLESGNGLINFILGDRIRYLPMADVNRWWQDGDTGSLRDHFADRVVVLGNVTAFRDRRPLPVRLFDHGTDPGGLRQPGVVAHLQAYRTYQAGRIIHPVGQWQTALVALLGLLGWWSSSRSRRLTLLLGAGWLGFLVLDTWLLRGGTHLPAGAVLVSMLLGFGGRIVYESFQAMAERRRLRNLFSGYVSPQVLSSILSGELAFDRSGELKRVGVLFSDIRSFTRRSEEQRPEAVIALLNRYFDRMVNCIHDRGGTVDKFIGDGLMAFFGAPNGVGSPAGVTMDCATSMLASLEQFNRELVAEGIEPLRIGIGLHVGEVVVGHVGSSGRHEYTAIGDAVNVAARLEELSKRLDHPIVVSRQLAQELPREMALTDLGDQPIRGRSSLRVFGYPGAAQRSDDSVTISQPPTG